MIAMPGPAVAVIKIIVPDFRFYLKPNPHPDTLNDE